jgi:hypothetical protein
VTSGVSGAEWSTTRFAGSRARCVRWPPGGLEGPREASPSLVYGAALLMRLGFTPLPGSNPGASADGQVSCWPTTEHAPVAQRIEHLTTDQKVGSSNLFGRAI